MAKVPRLRTVAPRPLNLPRSNVSARSMGDPIGRGVQNLAAGLQDVGTSVGNIAADQILRDNTRAAKNADVDFTTRIRELMYGEGGFMSKHGENAVQAAPALKEEVNKILNEIGDSLNKQSVRDIFMAQAQDRLRILLDDVDSRTIKEREVAELASSKARISGAIEDFARNPSNPDLQRQSESIIQSEVHDMVDRLGLDSEARQQELEAQYTLLYQTGVESLLALGRSKEARTLLESKKSKIDGPVYAMLVEQVKNGSVLAEAQQAVDNIIAQKLDPATARAFIRNSLKEETREKALLLYDKWLSEQADTARAQSAEAETSASAWLNGGHGTLDEWKIQNPTLARILESDHEAHKAIRGAEKDALEGKRFSQVDTGRYNEIMQMSRLDQTNIRLDSLKETKRLTESQYDTLVRVQKEARDSLRKDSESYTQFEQGFKRLKFFAPEDIKEAWDDPGISGDDLALRNHAISMLNDAISAHRILYGQQPTAEDLDRIVQNIWQEGLPDESPFWFGWFFTDDPESVVEADLRDKNFSRIPIEYIQPNRIRQLERVLKEADRPVTTENIERLAASEVLRDRDMQNEVLGLAGTGVKDFYLRPSIDQVVNDGSGPVNVQRLHEFYHPPIQPSPVAVTPQGSEPLGTLLGPAPALMGLVLENTTGTPAPTSPSPVSNTPNQRAQLQAAAPQPVVPAAQPLQVEGPLPRQSEVRNSASPSILNSAPNTPNQQTQPQVGEPQPVVPSAQPLEIEGPLPRQSGPTIEDVAKVLQEGASRLFGELEPISPAGATEMTDFEVDADLTKAVMQVESGGDANAVSPVGAQGLFQVMPHTARDPGFGVEPLEDPFDPVESERFFKEYMGAMLRRYRGKLEYALAAYNWGVGKTDDWVREGADVKKLPKETRNYIKKIGKILNDG